MSVHCGGRGPGHTSRILGTVHGSGSGDMNPPVDPVIESNFRDGVYKINGSAVTLDDVWVEDSTNWTTWTGYTITPGLGYVKQDGGAPQYLGNDNHSPVLKQPLFGDVINLTDGFTVLIEGSITYNFQPFDDADGFVQHQVAIFFGLELAQFPDYNADFGLLVGPNYIANEGDPSPASSEQKGQAVDYDGTANKTDSIAPLPDSPMIVRIAATFTSAGVTFSLNGRPTQSTTDPLLNPELVTDIALVNQFTNQLSQTTAALEYVAFYPKFANDADLMTLTAP